MGRLTTRTWLAAAVVCLTAAGVAHASQLTLTTDAPPASPAQIAPGSTGQVLVQVINDVAADPVADQMAAWQFRLQLVPDAGATGTATIVTPLTGPAPNPPSYVFGSAGLGIIDTNSGTQIDANDFHDFSGTGTSQVPTSPGANLLALGISVSPGATGTFGIFAVEGAAATEWTDGGAVPGTRFFTNVPNGTGTVRIGSISVVPEPGTLSGLLLASAAMLLRRRGQRRRANGQR